MEAKKLAPVEITPPVLEKDKSTVEKVKETLTEEIVIGICSPIGCDKYKVIDYLKARLEKDYGYSIEEIKLSDFLVLESINDKGFKFEEPEDGTKIFKEYLSLIKKGNHLRENYNYSVLAELAVDKIFRGRKLPKEDDQKRLKSRRVCYIINSIKHKEELSLLRNIYRDSFYLFSIYSPMVHRESLLSGRNFAKEEISKIIEIDLEEEEKHGQKVIKVFQEADFFLRVDAKTTKDRLKERIDRYFHLIFGSKIVTPTSGETAMYQAKSAACNSACLSRQVGAAITSKAGDVLSTGWNDVPKFGGSLYMEHRQAKDHRCVYIGNQCLNSATKNNIISNLIDKLVENNLLNGDEASIKSATEVISKTEIADLTEFSRAVHAEMHAIIQGTQQSGDKMVGGKLYCTTYPCHNCARHIVVAGIEEIYYIEPYKKSRCIELHEDSMTEDEDVKNKVRILMFDGVSPNRYLEFFKAAARKDKKSGKGLDLNMFSEAKPRTMLSLEALPTLEGQAVHSIEKMGLIKSSN